jgi:ferredoxin-NADP reductase
LAGHQVYLCGHPDFVKAMQRKCFLAGASLPDIHADAFLPSQSTKP